MKGWFGRHRVTADLGRLDEELAGLGSPLTIFDRACCCPGRPAVRVIMPAAPGRPHPVDLLMCGHHYRASRAALHAAGASVYDRAGLLVLEDGASPSVGDRPRATAVSRSRTLGAGPPGD